MATMENRQKEVTVAAYAPDTGVVLVRAATGPSIFQDEGKHFTENEIDIDLEEKESVN